MRVEGGIEDKSYTFALRMVKAYQYLTRQKTEYILSKQMLRSGTSIGANVREAKFAQSRADFVNKMSISLKEANETQYWIDLLHDSEYMEEAEYTSISTDCKELIAMLVTIVKSSKESKEEKAE